MFPVANVGGSLSVFFDFFLGRHLGGHVLEPIFQTLFLCSHVSYAQVNCLQSLVHWGGPNAAGSHLSGQGHCVQALPGLVLNPHLFIFERLVLLCPLVTGTSLSPDAWEGRACARWEEEVGNFLSHVET